MNNPSTAICEAKHRDKCAVWEKQGVKKLFLKKICLYEVSNKHLKVPIVEFMTYLHFFKVLLLASKSFCSRLMIIFLHSFLM